VDDWVPAAPQAIAPAPAAGRPDLRGKRVIVGLPGTGWRNDLRADAAVTQASRTYVPILTEHEWYRAEAEQTEVFAPLVPIERVWVELAVPAAAQAPQDLYSRLVSLDAPPRREPVPVRECALVTGRRVVWVEPDSERRDLRAVTEVYQNNDGDVCVRIAKELDWYRWTWSGQAPSTIEVPVYLLWLE
jgi:hypothetical protein